MTNYGEKKADDGEGKSLQTIVIGEIDYQEVYFKA